MQKNNIEVLRKILYAVESGNQIYGEQDYSAFSEAGENCDKSQLELANGMLMKRKNCYTEFREKIPNYSRIWIMRIWKLTC